MCSQTDKLSRTKNKTTFFTKNLEVNENFSSKYTFHGFVRLRQEIYSRKSAINSSNTFLHRPTNYFCRKKSKLVWNTLYCVQNTHIVYNINHMFVVSGTGVEGLKVKTHRNGEAGRDIHVTC